MSKYSVGDNVRVVRKFQEVPGNPGWYTDPGWYTEMDKTLGMVGKVFRVRSNIHPEHDNGFDRCCVAFPDGCIWWYLDSALELEAKDPVPVQEFFNGFL